MNNSVEFKLPEHTDSLTKGQCRMIAETTLMPGRDDRQKCRLYSF